MKNNRKNNRKNSQKDTSEEKVPEQEVCEETSEDTAPEAEKEVQAEQTAEQTAEQAAETAEPEQPEPKDQSGDKVKQLEDQLAAEKEKLLRTAAEYANFRSRTEREKLSIYSNAVSDTIKELLPIADSIDRAIDASKDAPEEFRKGLEMISNQLAKTFEKLNITSFGKVGDTFDPELHDAISSTDSDELESDTIAMVYQKGYKVGDKIIRHCMVQTVN